MTAHPGLLARSLPIRGAYFLGALLWLTLCLTPAYAVECIRGPYLQDAAAGEITIRWELDRVGPSVVEYRGSEGTATRVECAFRGRKHRVRLTGLHGGDRYRYRILHEGRRVTDEFEFRATPTGSASFTFAVFGDFGAGTPGQMAVAKLLEGMPAEFALLCGDMVYSRGEEEHQDPRRAKIDIVFAGHDHSYERTRPMDGVIYIVSGNAGARLYPHKNPHDYTERFYNQRHGLTLVTIEGPRLRLRHVNVDGQEIDRLELRKPEPARPSAGRR